MVGLKPEDIDSLHTKLDIRPLRLQRISEHDVYNVKIVQIAQHPQGKPKRFSMGRVCDIQEKYILYDADTTAGSSGSPVFYVRDEDCCVLAVHKSGGVVTSSCKQPVNKGVFINIILDYLSGGKLLRMVSMSSRVRWITNRGLDNSRYHTKTEFNNCFIIYSKARKKAKPFCLHFWNTAPGNRSKKVLLHADGVCVRIHLPRNLAVIYCTSVLE